MTVITHVRQKSRLSSLIDSQGGVSVGVALTRARTNIAALRSRALEEITRHIAILSAVPAPADAATAQDLLAQVYRSASDVVDAAAPFELEEICAAAISLCEVADRLSTEADPDWRVIEVHIQSLRLLNVLPPEASQERAQITDQLQTLVDRKFGQAG
jgi:hypothetical protein